MAKKIIGSGLRRQLAALFVIIIILVLITQMFYSISNLKKSAEQNRENCYNIIRQTDSMLSIEADRIYSMGDAVSDNEFVQKLLYLNDMNEGKENISQRAELMGFLFNYLGGIIKTNDELTDIVLIDNNEKIISINNNFNYINYQKINNEFDLKNLKQGIFTPWYDFGTDQAFNNGFAYIVPVYYTTGNFQSEPTKLGVCIIWCNGNPMTEVAVSTAATDNSTVIITDSKGYVIALNSKYTQSEVSEELDRMLSGNQYNYSLENIQEMKFMGQKAFILIKEHVNTGWRSINIVPKNGVYEEAQSTFFQGMVLAVISILILLFSGMYIIHSITRPLVQITTVLDDIGKGNRKNRIKIREQNEFSIISDSINSMLDNLDQVNHRIFDMQSQLYEKELIQKEAEMLTLQSQINPHFLYNTLECIRAIALISGIKEIPVITTSMANIFRYSIKGGMIATVKQELDCIKDYYKIIAIRYNDRLKMTFDMDEKILTCSLLKMSLQPIIENSVYHGLEATEDVIQIDIKGWLEEDYVCVSIDDNGIGMEESQVLSLNESFIITSSEEIAQVGKSKSSIGLTNINARIKLHYGSDCGLLIESTKEIGTKVTMKIKFQTEL